MSWYLGIDPGSSSGGASLVGRTGRLITVGPVIRAIKFGNSTEHEIAHWFEEVVKDSKGELKAALEKVHSMPKQSAQSGFTFGQSYGLLRGLLAAYKVPFVEPSPQRWQKDMSCRTGGDKNVSKQAAHERWPAYTRQITHAVADSLLIAEWLRLYGDKR